MKKKFSRILGVGLALVLVLALAVAVVPTNTPNTAEAAVGKLRFGTIPLPKFRADGNYVLTPGVDVGPIAVTAGGSVMFASASITPSANLTSVLKSSDDGYTWRLRTGFRTAADVKSDTTSIVDIVASPEYSIDTSVFVATEKYVYQSVDGGKTFSAVDQPTGWTATENITDMDVALDSSGRLSVIIGSAANQTTGDVYVYCPTTTGLSWKAQDVGASHNVLAVAFSPNFTNDEGIMAVTCNGTETKMKLSFGNTKDGGGWGDSVGDAKFVHNGDVGKPIKASRARIAFPDDFDVDSITSNIAFVGISGTATGVDPAGDVFKVILLTGTRSAIEDLGVRRITAGITRKETNIWSIDVSGDAEAANILVGTNNWDTTNTPYQWLTYYSTDSGATWLNAGMKSPTGGNPDWDATTTALVGGTYAETHVVLSPSFATDNVCYATTKGAATSALSRSTDGGKSWNQISLIDYANTDDNYTVAAVMLDRKFNENNTFLLLTKVAGRNGAVWKTTNGGANYQRIFSYANPSVTQTINTFKTVSDNTVFVMDYTEGKFWRSTDGGATFPRLINAKAQNIKICVIADENTIYTAYSGGDVWYTTKLGRPWVKLDWSGIEGIPRQIARKGDHFMVPTYSGTAFISTDGGQTFKRLGVTDLADTSVVVSFDRQYSTNHYLYAYVEKPGGGIYRIEIDEDYPGSSEWRRIDAGSPRTSTVYPRGMLMLGDNVLYVIDRTAANVTDDTAGGIWRCVNPTADLDGTSPPVFTKENNGLSNGDVLSYMASLTDPNTLFCINTNADYYNQLIAFADVLSSPVTLVAPADKAPEEGVRLETIDLTLTVELSWDAVPGATEYKWEVAYTAAMDSTYASGATAGQQVRVDGLMPDTTYYWRVRVEEPLMSPWSEKHSFTAYLVTPLTPLEMVSPATAAQDVPVKPTFVWSAVEGATGYEFMISKDPAFTILEWRSHVDNNIYLAELNLAYSTTYYWRVRHVVGPRPSLTMPAPGGEWVVGIFTTEAEPVETTPPVVVEPTPPPEVQIVEVPVTMPIAIPIYLLWVVIDIGVILFIALIVIIVRTRHVT